jgi:hypothetical protein
LTYFRTGSTRETYGWTPFTSTLEILDLPPGQTWAVRLAVRRTDMVHTSPDHLFQSLLDVRDDTGCRQLIGVSSQGLLNAFDGTGGSVPLPPHAGLWVGTAVLRQVSEPAHSNPAQQSVPTPTGSEYQFRLIVHVDQDGQTRLLQKVLQLWKPADDAYVLLTDESLASNPAYVTVSSGDGALAPRRVSTTAFGFANPILMSGTFGDSNACVVALGAEDPLNPYRHKYHPDHDNLDSDGQPLPPDRLESFTVTRRVSLAFQSTDPEGLELSGWGDTWHGGVYREQISGLHRASLNIQGIFRLRRISQVAQLNDPQP